MSVSANARGDQNFAGKVECRDSSKQHDGELCRWPVVFHGLRRIFSTSGLDTLQNREAQEHDGAHCDPMRGHMQDYSSVNQAADQDQEAENINSE